MTVTLSFSGGASHGSEVSESVQQQIADRVASAVKELMEKNHASGTGSVSVSGRSATIVASATTSIEDEFAEPKPESA